MNPFRNFIHVLRHYKTATILNLLGLTVAFASFMVIMAQVRYDLSFDRHYKNTDRIFRIEYTEPSMEGTYSPALSRNVGDQVVSVSADIEQSGLISHGNGLRLFDPERGRLTTTYDYTGYGIKAGILDVLEFECLQGDFARISTPGTLLISQTAAKSLFGENNPVGRQVVVNDGSPLEVVGVFRDFPENSSVARKSIVWDIGDDQLNNPNYWAFEYYFRISSPDKIEKVKAEVDSMMEKRYPEGKNNLRFVPIADIHLSNDLLSSPTLHGKRTTIYSLFAVAVLVLLIAVINFINFAMALVPVRIRYINTQKVLGGSTAGIRRNLIVESVGIALLAYLAAILLVEYLSQTRLAELFDAKITTMDNLPVMAQAAGAAVLCGLLAGIYPAFYSTSFNPAIVLKGSFGLSARGRRLRTILIGFQYTISIILIVTALSIHLQNKFMRNFDMGFSRENILTATLPVSSDRTGYLSQKLKSHPGITDVTFASMELVLDGRSYIGLPHKGKQISIETTDVAPNYIPFMGLRIIDGRDFLETDMNKDLRTMMVNKTSHLQDSVLVGERLFDYEIVGVVDDFHHKPLRFDLSSFAFTTTPHGYFQKILVRINTPDPGPVIAYIRQVVREQDPLLGGDIRFLDDDIDRLYQKEENLSTLILLFSLLSVLISVVGVFGLVLFETQYRRKEIGLRKVNGATAGEILWMFNKTYVRIVAVCFVVASPAAYLVVNKWGQNFAYRTPIAPWVFAAALLIVLLIVIATISLQCYKTASNNPIDMIRSGE